MGDGTGTGWGERWGTVGGFRGHISWVQTPLLCQGGVRGVVRGEGEGEGVGGDRRGSGHPPREDVTERAFPLCQSQALEIKRSIAFPTC